MKNIFVGNLNSNTSEGALRQLFVAFGPVDQVKIMMDSYTGKSREFGFVEMANAEGRWRKSDRCPQRYSAGRTCIECE